MRREITTLDALAAAGRDLKQAVVVGLDLTGPDADAQVQRAALDEAVFLGCDLSAAARRRADASSALVFPVIPRLPYRAYRSTLYTPAELFAGFDAADPRSYERTPDAVVYRHVRAVGAGRPDPLHALAERLHDHSITEALDDVLDAARAAGRAAPVAVMGGHALDRASAGYARAAELGRALGRSQARFTVLTGGGPGAMEAVPLGVRLAGLDDAALGTALAGLAAAPTFDVPVSDAGPLGHGGRPQHGGPAAAVAPPVPGGTAASGGTTDEDAGRDDADPDAAATRAIGRWLAAAAGVPDGEPAVDGLPRSIGIPTWFYGHEPPNPFCDAHAKYFANSVREDGLLTVASGGIVYTPGSAGTVQEVFADYTQNHYGSVGPPAPMVFLGVRHWTVDVPAAPLVRRLATGRAVEPLVLVTDSVPEAVAFLEAYAASA